VGASFALNLALHDTTAEILNGGAISGSAASITVAADAHHASETEAKNGASGGTAVGGAVAVFISDSDTKARIGSSGTGMTTGGGHTDSAANAGGQSGGANSKSSTQNGSGGSGVGVAASIAIGYLNVSNTAETLNGADIDAGGAAAISAQQSIDAKAQSDS